MYVIAKRPHSISNAHAQRGVSLIAFWSVELLAIFFTQKQ